MADKKVAKNLREIEAEMKPFVTKPLFHQPYLTNKGLIAASKYLLWKYENVKIECSVRRPATPITTIYLTGMKKADGLTYENKG